jgi:hypothetical protein
VPGRVAQHVGEAAERVLADHLGVVVATGVPDAAARRGDVQVVGPEPGDRLEQLPLAPRGAGDDRLAELTEAVVGVVRQGGADGGRGGVRQGETLQQLVAGRVVDLLRGELAVEPAVEAQLARLGEGLRGGAERGPAQQVRDRVDRLVALLHRSNGRGLDDHSGGDGGGSGEQRAAGRRHAVPTGHALPALACDAVVRCG